MPMLPHFGTVWRRWCTSPYLSYRSRSLQSYHRCDAFPALWSTANAAPRGGAAIDSLGWGNGAGGTWLCDQVLRLWRRGTPWQRMGPRWTSPGSRCLPQATALETSCRRNGTPCLPRRWTPLVVPPSTASTWPSGHGSWAMTCGGIPEHPRLAGQKQSVARKAELSGPSQDGCSFWWRSQTSTYQQAVLPVDPSLDRCAPDAWSASAMHAQKHVLTRCVVKKRDVQATYGWICRRFAMESVPGTSSNNSSGSTVLLQQGSNDGHLRQAIGLLILLGAWWGDHRAVQCMDQSPERPEAGAVRWHAADAIQQVEAHRLATWRTTHGLEADEDFAFIFVDYHQALAAAGPVVADGWMKVRAEAQDGMLHAVDQAVDDLAARRQVVTRSLATRFRHRQGAVRLRPNTAEAPQAIQDRATALQQVWLTAGVLQPAGHLTASRRQDWEAACLRMAQRHVTEAEAVTVNNSLLTFHELLRYQQGRGRALPPDPVDLDGFLHTGTAAPTRALTSLKWLVRHGSLAWELTHLQAPKKIPKAQQRAQAAVVLPPMLAHLEEQIELQHRMNNPNWLALVGSWVIAMGVVRHKHLSRSLPRRITLAYVHLHCSRGKQRRLRSGFDWAVPGTLTTGFKWCDHWLTAWKALPAERRGRTGLSFEVTSGHPFGLKEMQQLTQQCFHGALVNPQHLTSYSWRRLAPSVGHILHMSPDELSSLGDWQDRSQQNAQSAMAIHYSDAKYSESLKTKAAVWGAMTVFKDCEAWESIPLDTTEMAKEAGRKQVQILVGKDTHTIWASPSTSQDTAKRFAMSKELKEKAAQRRARSRGADAIRHMPHILNGKQLSSFLRDGSLLCGAYQTNQCQHSPETCEGLHRCAVLCRTGRVCGGHHRAGECRDKRFLPADLPQQSGPASSSQGGTEAIPPAHRPVAKAGNKRPPEPSQPPRRKKTRQVEPANLPVVVDEDAQAEQHFDRLATTRGRTAEAPTLVFQSEKGGKIWLSGMPTEATAHLFPRTDLQVICFQEDLARRGGVVLPSAMTTSISPAWAKGRVDQWRLAWPLIRNSVWSGDQVLVHCLSGRHRAAAVATMLRSLLAGESLETSGQWLAQHRDVELQKVSSQNGVALWMRLMVQQATVGSPMPQVVGFISTLRSHTHLRTLTGAPLCCHKQDPMKALERLQEPLISDDAGTAAGWGRPACAACEGKAPASWQKMIRDFW